MKPKCTRPQQKIHLEDAHAGMTACMLVPWRGPPSGGCGHWPTEMKVWSLVSMLHVLAVGGAAADAQAPEGSSC